MEYIVDIPDRDLTDRKRLYRCNQCRYWKPDHVKENDGTERLYKEGEADHFGMKLVSLDVGINIGAMCCVDVNCGYDNEPVYRQANDYCSRAEPLPEGMTYPRWWGWKDSEQE